MEAITVGTSHHIENKTHNAVRRQLRQSNQLIHVSKENQSHQLKTLKMCKEAKKDHLQEINRMSKKVEV